MANPEHNNLEADLSAYLDGELSASRTQAVEHLLAESAETRRTLEDLRQVRDQLTALPRLQLPAEPADSLVRRAEKELISRSAPAARRARLLRLFGPLTAVAAVLVVGLFIGYQALEPYLATRLNSPTPRAEPAAKPEPPHAVAREPQEPTFAARGGSAESKKLDRSAPDESARLKSLGYTAAPPPAVDKAARAPAAVAPPETALAEAPAEESIPATSVAVVIQTQHEADYVSNAARQVEQGGLPGAIRADQTHNLAGPHVEVHAIHRHHAAKTLVQTPDAQERRVGS